jgi:hypothetical protein
MTVEGVSLTAGNHDGQEGYMEKNLTSGSVFKTIVTFALP